MEHRNDLRISFSEFIKRLDPSASYVIAEKPSGKLGQTDLRELDVLAGAFRHRAANRSWIYDATAGKWILVIELKEGVEDGFFKCAVLPLSLKEIKVYLWSSR